MNQASLKACQKVKQTHKHRRVRARARIHTRTKTDVYHLYLQSIIITLVSFCPFRPVSVVHMVYPNCLIFIPRHTLVAGYYVSRWPSVCLSVCPSVVRTSVRPSVRPHFVSVRSLKYLLTDFIQILHMHLYQQCLAWDC